MFPRTPRNTSVYTRHPTFVTATSGVLTWLPEKLSKNGMRVYTLSDRAVEKKIACIHGLRSEGVNNFSVNETKSGQPNKHLFSLTFRELNS